MNKDYGFHAIYSFSKPSSSYSIFRILSSCSTDKTSLAHKVPAQNAQFIHKVLAQNANTTQKVLAQNVFL